MQCDGAYITVTSEMLQEFNLSQRSFGQNLLAEHIGYLLDRHSIASLIIRSRAISVHISLVSPDVSRLVPKRGLETGR